MQEIIYEHFEAIITLLTIFTIAVNVINHWCISQQKMHKVYCFSMIVYVGYIIIETLLAFRHPEQKSILLFNITNIWALMMAIKGYFRLKKLDVVN